MKKQARLLAALISGSLILGPSSAHAAAAVASVRIAPQGLGASSAAGAAVLGLSGSSSLSSASSLTLSPSFNPAGVSVNPGLSVPSQAAAVSAQARTQSPTAGSAAPSSAASPSAAISSKKAAAVPSSQGAEAVSAKAVAVETRAPKAALIDSSVSALVTGREQGKAGKIGSLAGLEAAAVSAEASRKTFDNAASRAAAAGAVAAGASASSLSSAEAVSGAAAQGRIAPSKTGLRHSGYEGPASDPDFRHSAQPLAPAKKSSVWRSVKIGWLAAMGSLFMYTVVFAGAAVFGYEFHPSYAMPDLGGEGAQPSLIADVLTTFMAAVLAPLNEEVYFRAGMMGLLAMGATRSMGTALRFFAWATSRWEKVSAWFTGFKRFINPAAFWYSGIVTAVFFVLLHETSDPVLITTRLIQAVVMSWLFAKEGLLAGIFNHGFFNLFASVLFIGLVTLPAGGFVAALGPSLFLFAVFGGVLALSARWTRKSLARETAEIKAGERVPYRLTARGSTILGMFSLAATAVVLVPGMLWANPFLLGMAIQMMPAAAAFFVYASSLADYKQSKGEQALRDNVTEPTAKYAMFNAPGAVAAVKTYLGLLAAIIGMGVGMAFLPGLPSVALIVAGAASLLMLAFRGMMKTFFWKSFWGTFYTIFIAAALGMLAAPWAQPVLAVIQEMAAAMPK